MDPQSTPEASHPPMLSLTEAAAMLRCHPNTVRAWVRQGKLTPVPMGPEKVNMYLKEEVERLRKPLERAGVIVKDDKHAFPVVGIGASAGGLDAMSRLLAQLPTDLGLAYVFVTHQEKDQEKTLAQVLRKKTTIPVFVVENGMRLEPDHLYVSPAGMHAAVINSTFTLQVPRGVNGQAHRPIDAFFTALANEYQNNAIGIVLSGGGMDGTEGLRAIKAEDGLTFAQDGSAQDKSMPESAVEAGVVDLVRAPEQIASELAQLVKELYPGGTVRIPAKHENEMRRILQYLLEQRGVDFSEYKETTIHRRIIRRMVLSKCRKLSEYAALLRGIPSELDTLYNDLLINVTSFFRDPAFHQALTERVLPELFKDRVATDALRIWVPACAGGEEVVSIAITLLEFLGDHAKSTPVQIFATDLNERTIEKARLGIYKKSALQDMAPERVAKFFMHVDGHFQVIKPIRDMCVFAKHDLLKDPPFSRVDLISCQNVLIYLESAAQGRILKSFHYALDPSGFLVLGRSETPANAGDIFIQPEREYKVYRKKRRGSSRLEFDLRYKPAPAPSTNNGARPSALRTAEHRGDLDRELEQLLLHRYVPASVLVNKDLDIVRFLGSTAPFLGPSTGRASLNLLKMVRDDLAFELRALMMTARKEGIPARKSGIPIRLNGGLQDVGMEVLPLGGTRDPHFLVLFKEEGLVMPAAMPPGSGDPNARAIEARDKRIAQLEQELRDAREQVRLVSEESEVTMQELQASNEEVVSSNEELQSINEELETSKEELQSINEEFATINEELQQRNDSLRESEERLRLATRTGKVGIWDWDVVGDRITWSDSLYDIHGVKPETFDPSSRGFAQLVHPEDLQQVATAIERALKSDARYELEFRAVRPDGATVWLFTNASVLRVDGRAVRMLGATLDITILKEKERALAESEERFKAVFQHSPFGIVLADGEGRMVDVNPSYSAMLGIARSELVGKTSLELGLVKDKEVRKAIMDNLRSTGHTRNAEMELVRADGSTVVVRSNAEVVLLGAQRFIISMVEDVTERRANQQRLQDLGLRLDLALNSADLGTWNIDGKVEFMKVDERFKSIFGWTEESITVPQAFSVLHPDDRERTRVAIEGATRPEDTLPYEVEYRVVHPDGSIHWVLAKGRSTFTEGENKELVSFDGTVMDITARKQAEEAQRSLAAIVESSEDAIISKDLDGLLTSWNKGAERMFGYTAQEIIGQPNSILFPPDRLEEERILFERLKNGERIEHYESVRVHKNGSAVQVALTLSPLKNERGDIVGASKTIRDITEEKRAREVIRLSEERFHLLADNVVQLVWMAEADGSAMWFNRRWFEFTGMTSEQIRMDAKSLHHPDHYERVTDSLKARAAAGEQWEEQFPLKSKEGKYHWFIATAMPVRDAAGTVVRWFGTLTDITKEREDQERVRNSEERFRLLADNIAQLAWIAEPNGDIHWYNKRWFDYTGTTMEDVRGWGWQNIHHPDHVDRVTQKFRTHLEAERDWEDTFPIRGADGGYRWFLSRAFPVRDPEGKVMLWFGTNTDVTEERAAREEASRSEERFRLLADNMSQMAYTADAAGHITWVNRRWLEYTGLNVDEMNDGGWGRAVDPEHYEGMVASYTKAQMEGVTWEHIFRLRNIHGDHRWFLSRSVPIHDANGKVQRWFGTNTDITEQKLAEEALEESAKHKDHFLATLAHELRNPLAPLKNGLQLMELAPDDPQMLETTREMMVRQLDHMVRLVDDLLDLSRISRGKIDLKKENVPLHGALCMAMEASKPLLDRNGHALILNMAEQDLVVYGDVARLTQVISNLLNNAAKYTPAGGRIELSVQREDDTALIRVKDNGIGIEPAAMPHVFDMFSQVESETKNGTIGGLGIGLNVVQRLVHMHHGEVEGHSAGLGSGSEFVVRLPLVAVTERPKEVVVQKNTAQVRLARRVLVVDDNDDIALSMSMILKRSGHDVAVAHDGEQAVAMADSFKPEVILMDIGMPRMNGYEACAAIRATEAGRSMHIIAVSGWGQEEDRKKSQQAGFDGHVVKPMEKATLERVIAEAKPHDGA